MRLLCGYAISGTGTSAYSVQKIAIDGVALYNRCWWRLRWFVTEGLTMKSKLSAALAVVAAIMLAPAQGQADQSTQTLTGDRLPISFPSSDFNLMNSALSNASSINLFDTSQGNTLTSVDVFLGPDQGSTMTWAPSDN